MGVGAERGESDTRKGSAGEEKKKRKKRKRKKKGPSVLFLMPARLIPFEVFLFLNPLFEDPNA